MCVILVSSWELIRIRSAQNCKKNCTNSSAQCEMAKLLHGLIVVYSSADASSNVQWNWSDVQRHMTSSYDMSDEVLRILNGRIYWIFFYVRIEFNASLHLWIQCVKLWIWCRCDIKESCIFPAGESVEFAKTSATCCTISFKIWHVNGSFASICAVVAIKSP